MCLHVLKYINPLNNSLTWKRKLILFLFETENSCSQKFSFLREGGVGWHEGDAGTGTRAGARPPFPASRGLRSSEEQATE